MSDTSGTFQPPSQWTTGEDPATEKQASFLSKLAADKGVDVDTEHISKAEASEKIDELKKSSASTSGGGTSSSASNSSTDEPAITAPSNWATGEDPATQKQKGFIAVLEKRAGEGVHDLAGISKAEASERIEDLKKRTGQ